MTIIIQAIQPNYFIIELNTIEYFITITTLLRNNFITYDANKKKLKIYVFDLGKVAMVFKNSEAIKKILII